MSMPSTQIENKPHILVVDDSRVMRRALSKILGQEYAVTEADHGEDGWTMLLNDDSIQVVFTDLSMPYLDGFGLLKRIREAEDPRLAKLPVIVITGKEDDDETKQEALQAGASDFITKPFESVQLKARAKVHVEHQAANRQLSESAAAPEDAATDPLTGLGTKAYFLRSAAESLAHVKRHGGTLTLMRVDVDGFNQLFIKHGRSAADQVLAKVGQCLGDQLRDADRVARIGLAKFAVLLQGDGLDGARHLAERICKQVTETDFNIQGQAINLDVGIGVAQPTQPETASVESLIAEAEERLAQARRQGGRIGLPDEAAASVPDVASALTRLARGDGNALAPHAEALARQVMPLVELYAATADIEVQTWVASLKKRLGV